MYGDIFAVIEIRIKYMERLFCVSLIIDIIIPGDEEKNVVKNVVKGGTMRIKNERIIKAANIFYYCYECYECYE